MQQARQRFAARGIGLAAVSYDSPAILSEFAERQKIEYPLLSDSNSAIIRGFGVLNHEAKGMMAGIPHPGFFFIAPDGVVREKFFEANYAERYTANSVIARLFPELAEGGSDMVSLPHLQLRATQSDHVAGPGSRITLGVEITLPPRVHVYAPGVKGYKPVALVIDEIPQAQMRPAEYPKAKILWLAAIKEKVPVFEGSFRVLQDVVLAATPSAMALPASGERLTIHGKLKYQACDDKICYLPAEAPLQWTLDVKPLDMRRSPEEIQHKK